MQSITQALRTKKNLKLFEYKIAYQSFFERCDALAADATVITPLSETRFRITDIQEHRINIEFVNSGDSQPLQCEQFETLAERITDTSGTFELQRLPPDAEPYAAALSLHPRYEIDDREGTLTETDDPTASQLIKGATTRSGNEQDDTGDRTEPDLDDLRQSGADSTTQLTLVVRLRMACRISSPVP